MSETKQCWECLKKRLVCDFTRPACKKCHLRKIECPGYDHKPLKWMRPGQTKSKQRTRSARRTSPVTPAGATADGHQPNNARQAIITSPTPILADPTGATTIFEALEYYNTNICPDMLATGQGGSQNPFYMPPSFVSHIPPSLVQSLICITLAHRILQCGDSLASDETAVSRRKLQGHRGKAIRLLAQELASERSQPEHNDRLLGSVLTFLFAEAQQSVSSDWRQHVNAVNSIIDMQGGMAHFILSQPFFRPNIRYFVLVDIMGSTTAPEVELSSVRRQLEMITLLPVFYGNGLSTSLPCPPELLADIIMINHLRSRLKRAKSHSRDRSAAALEILLRVKFFSSEQWAANIKLSPRDRLVDDDDSTIGNDASSSQNASSWDWQSIAEVFQSAVALYCISSLVNPGQGGATTPQRGAQHHTNIPFTREKYRDQLLCSLHRVATNPSGRLRKLVIWPLVVAGIELDPADEASRSFVLGELQWISGALGTASPLTAIEFLRGLWRSSMHLLRDDSNTWWDRLFDRAYVFAM